MTLKEALENQGINEVDDVIEQMIDDVVCSANPEEVLEEYGLEPDYVIDLINMI